MSREVGRDAAPNFRPATKLEWNENCWECDHEYDFKFGKIGEERMTSLTCDSFKEI